MRAETDKEKNSGTGADLACSHLRHESSYGDYVGLKQVKLFLANRIITKNNRTSFIYLAGGPSDWRRKNGFYFGAQNHNGVYRDKDEQTIFCRHLAFSWLSHHSRRGRVEEGYQGYHRLFASHETVRLLPFLHENAFDKLQVYRRADQRAIASVEGKALGQTLQKLCAGMKGGEEKYLLLGSENHSMAIVLKYKAENCLVVKFYDPNDTLVHKRVVCRGVEGLTDLALSDFLSRSNINRYFPTNQQMVLSVYESLDLNKLPASREDWRFKRADALLEAGALSTDLRVLSDQLYFALTHGSLVETQALMNQIIGCLSGTENLTKLLQTKKTDDTPGLYMALQNGCSETVRAYCEVVTADVNLTAAQRFDLLQAKAADGTPGLLVALYNGHTETVKMYLKAVAAAELELAQRFTLLQSRRANGAPGLYMAFQEGCSETVRVYCEAIVADTNLTVDQRFELLQAKTAEGFSGLSIALEDGHTETVKVYLKAVAVAELELTQRLALLQAKRADGVPGFFIELQNGHSETVRVYCEAIVADTNLTVDQRFEFLQARRADSTPGLSMALQNGHSETVRVYYEAIAADTRFTAAQRFEFLQAKMVDGTTGLYWALQNGHTETVKVYLKAIAVAELELTQRLALLQAKRADSIPGFFIALQNGHSETVRAYCEAIAADTRFTAAQRFEFLQARRADSTPGLSMALQNGHSETVRVYCEAIAADTRFTAAQRFELLQAKTADGPTGFYWALKNGHSETMRAYCKAIAADMGPIVSQRPPKRKDSSGSDSRPSKEARVHR